MSCGCGCGGEQVAYEDWGDLDVAAAEYQGRKVTLNKPFRTPGANKKFGVYTLNENRNVVLVRFGDPNMEIKRDDPDRRKNFRSRHNCDSPGPKWKARYWSCRQWESGRKVEAGMEDYIYSTREGAEEKSRQIGFDGATYMERMADGTPMYFPGPNDEEFQKWFDKNDSHTASECGCGDNVEADIRSTPAPPKDRRKGSKRNKPGSARPGGKVTFSESVTNSLKEKVRSHNEKSDRKVTLGMLKAVYRRGAGAYSTSHRPGVSRAAWSMARVNAFLKLVRSGKPSNPKYTQDNDLLPSGHPRKSKKASYDAPCGCGCMDDFEAEEIDETENLEAEMIRRDVFDNPGEAMERAKEMGCDEVHSHEEDGKTVFMPCKTHQEYMEKNDGMDVEQREEVEGYHHGMKKKEDEEASYHGSCPPGEEMKDGRCQKVAVTIDLDIDDVVSVIQASTGETIIEIKGIAFHEGMNKNKWSLTASGAEGVAEQMVGADVTLNHPKALSSGGFSRNMLGDVDEAVVGYITEASYENRDNGYVVRYSAHVVRAELFEALESGLWLRKGYGVSIGGSGVPIQADEDGMVFDSDFTFDHLAIVHKPAYQEANIESVKRIKIASTFKYHSASDEGQNLTVNTMSEEQTTDIENDMAALAKEMEDLKASLVLANSRVAEYEAAEDARSEEERLALVTEASELGMKGHEDLGTETLRGLIASWAEAHPEPAPVEMAPVAEAPAVASVIPTPGEEERPVVANYLNGKMIETDREVYGRAWNAWAKAWNATLATSEKDMKAPSFNDIKELI